MPNEFIFFIASFFDIFIVFSAGKLGRAWLYATIATNLILVSTFGAKLINIFGFTTNSANIFYACVFLATHILIEKYGKKSGLLTIPIGLISIILFIMLSQMTLLFAGTGDSSTLDESLKIVFQVSPRIAFASMVAYILAQFVNILVYDHIKKITEGQFLWLRDNLSNITGQFVDSILFFSIAFFGILPTDILIQSITAGYIIKLTVGIIGTFFLYGVNHET